MFRCDGGERFAREILGTIEIPHSGKLAAEETYEVDNCGVAEEWVE